MAGSGIARATQGLPSSLDQIESRVSMVPPTSSSHRVRVLGQEGPAIACKERKTRRAGCLSREISQRLALRASDENRQVLSLDRRRPRAARWRLLPSAQVRMKTRCRWRQHGLRESSLLGSRCSRRHPAQARTLRLAALLFSLPEHSAKLHACEVVPNRPSASPETLGAEPKACMLQRTRLCSPMHDVRSKPPSAPLPTLPLCASCPAAGALDH